MVIMQVCAYTLPCRFSLLVTLTLLSSHLDAFQNRAGSASSQVSLKENVHPTHACATVLISASFFMNINCLLKENSVLSLSGLNLAKIWEIIPFRISVQTEKCQHITGLSFQPKFCSPVKSSAANTSFLGAQELQLCRWP